MKNELHKSIMVILIIIIPILFSCATKPPAPKKPTPETFHDEGFFYSDKGQFEKAISAYNKALEIDPNYAPAYNALAWLYATAKEPRFQNGEKAVELALKACELSGWNEPYYLDTLAAAYARKGDFNNAVKWQEKALASPKLKDDAVAQLRLDFYRERKPWVDDVPNAGVELKHRFIESWNRVTSRYTLKNTTNERKCYRMLSGTIDTGWNELPPLGFGNQSIDFNMGLACLRPIYGVDPKNPNWDNSNCYVPFKGALEVMPYPRLGSCASYNGVIEFNNNTQQWSFDVEKTAKLLQRPVADVQTELIIQGMIPFPAMIKSTPVVATTQSPSPEGKQPPPPSLIISDLEKGWRGLSWGMSLAEFKTRFPKHSQDATWWTTGEGIEEFAGLWMKTRYAFNKHDRLSTVQLLPNQEDRSRVVESLAAALGQPTSEKEGNRFWNLPSRNVSVAAIFGNGMVVIQHGPLVKD
jgi:tetratricopeptide (TPR) repeat protein